MASDAVKQAAAELLARVHETSDAMDRADAIGWAVVVTDSAGTVLSSAVHAYGLCPTPEAALVVAGKLAAPGRCRGWMGSRRRADVQRGAVRMTYTDNEGVIRCSRCSLPLVPSESPFARPGQLDCPASGRDGWQHDSHIEDTTGSEP